MSRRQKLWPKIFMIDRFRILLRERVKFSNFKKRFVPRNSYVRCEIHEIGQNLIDGRSTSKKGISLKI